MNWPLEIGEAKIVWWLFWWLLALALKLFTSAQNAGAICINHPRPDRGARILLAVEPIPASAYESWFSTTAGTSFSTPLFETEGTPLTSRGKLYLPRNLRGAVPQNGNGWSPHAIKRFIQSYGTAAGTARVETDAGEGYIKALGNAEGPHVLAYELVGSLLGDWLGLSTLDFALIDVTADDEIPFRGGGFASVGPAFISRAEQGYNWGGAADELRDVHNQLSISGLVVLDTWIRNCDRYAPGGGRVNRDNVFFVQYSESGKVLLKAMDFTHAFVCGRELNRRLGFINNLKDDQIYGLFPEFADFLNREEIQRLALRLGEFKRSLALDFIAQVPKEWEVDQETKSAWATFIAERAKFVSQTVESKLWPQQELKEGGTA